MVPTQKPMPHRLVEEDGEIRVYTQEGNLVARLDRKQKKMARRIAEMPLMTWALERLLDGVQGYFSEHGHDGRYWQLPAVWEAQRLTGSS